MLLLVVEIKGDGALLCAEFPGSSAFASSGPRRFKPCLRPIPDQVALELRQCSEDVKHQPAARCGRVDGFLKALEPDLLLLQFRHKLNQVFERTPETIQPPNNKHVALAQLFTHTVKSGAMFGLSAQNVLKDFSAPCPPQCVSLKIKILLVGGYSGVADTHELPE